MFSLPEALRHLPVVHVLPALRQALEDRDEAVLEAPPGAGKTTVVPLELLGASWLDGQKILLLEPRRIAAKHAACRMAGLLGEPVGETVGYRMRLETRVSEKTRLEVVTEGVLAKMLQTDPSLEGVGLVIFDEFHERRLDADVSLAFLKYARDLFRTDAPLKLLLMSATLDGDQVSRYLDQAPVVRSDGRCYPVMERYEPPPPRGHRAGRDVLTRHVAEVTLQALLRESGSVLVFLPGQQEIRAVHRILAERLGGDETVQVKPLYGELSLQDQMAAIHPPDVGHRKVVLATSIAETSLTIEGVRVVVDSGLSRLAVFDPATGLTRLNTVRVSRAASEQRKGRAGRTEPGVVYRCWSETEQFQLAAHTPPEIVQADLSSLVLQLVQWGVSVDDLAWLTPPPRSAFGQASDLLTQLGAIESRDNGSVVMTAHGEQMANLPMPPRLAHMMLHGEAVGYGELASILAAWLSERDRFPGDQADLRIRLDCLMNAVSVPTHLRAHVKRIRRQARLYRDRLKAVVPAMKRQERHSVAEADAVGYLLALAYPDRIARQRVRGSDTWVLTNGRAAKLMPDDSLRREPWLVVAELGSQKGMTSERIWLAAALNPDLFESALSAYMRASDRVEWHPEKQQVVAERQWKIGKLTWRSEPLTEVNPVQKTRALLAGIRQAGWTALPWSEMAGQLMARVCLFRQWSEEVALVALATSLPDFSEEGLMARLEEWLAPFLVGKDRLSQLNETTLLEALQAQLSWDQRRALDEWVPERVEVPSGRQVRVDYRQNPPVVAVKLQEMFGATDTPAIGKGKVPLVLHLLSPAGRPLQVTQDLRHFWQNGYDAVRKEMRGRYPKHPWPEDPLQALPSMGTKKQEARKGTPEK